MTRGICALALLVSGCFAVNDPERHLPDALEPSELCPRLAEVYCEGGRDCCPPSGGFTDEQIQLCVDGVTTFCNESLSPIVNDPRSGFDGSDAARRMTEGLALAESCDPAFYTWFSDRDGLRGVPGTLGRGDDCSPRAGEVPNDSTSARFYACTDGLACVETERAGEWECADPLPEGARCVVASPTCQRGLYCSLEETCEPLAEAGEPCFGDFACESNVCAGVQVSEMLATGRCAPAEQTYCVDRNGCGNVAFTRDAGPLIAGYSCESAVVCTSMAQANQLRSLGWFCQTADPMDCGTRDFVCVYDDDGAAPVLGGPGELDAEEALELCNVGRIVTASMDVLVCSGP